MSAPSKTLARSAVNAGPPVTSTFSSSGQVASASRELVDLVGHRLLAAVGGDSGTATSATVPSGETCGGLTRPPAAKRAQRRRSGRSSGGPVGLAQRRRRRPG